MTLQLKPFVVSIEISVPVNAYVEAQAERKAHLMKAAIESVIFADQFGRQGDPTITTKVEEIDDN